MLPGTSTTFHEECKVTAISELEIKDKALM